MNNNGVAPPPLSLWAAVYSWFTPTVLFVLLNLVIGTIAVTSKTSSKSREDNEEINNSNSNTNNGSNENVAFQFARAPSLGRSPSIVFDRLRSFTFRRPAATPPPQQLPPATEINNHHLREGEGEGEELEHHQHLDRSQSDAKPTAGEVPEKLSGKIKKSASEMSAFSHFKETDVAAATEAVATRVNSTEENVVEDQKGGSGGGGGEVDARADAFITRFKQQLKLQRLESIMRYREMLGRGT